MSGPEAAAAQLILLNPLVDEAGQMERPAAEVVPQVARGRGPNIGEDTMRYAVLIYEKPGAYDPLSSEERRAVTAEYLAIRDDPRIVDGARLQPAEMATTVRVQGGETLITDGPFADTKEVFGGYYVLEAADLDVAIDVAARIPAARLGGSVEIRPMVELER
jgi:hypothetical protein